MFSSPVFIVEAVKENSFSSCLHRSDFMAATVQPAHGAALQSEAAL